MPEVNVNIRGRDDGLGSHLESLRQKANSLGVDITRLNNISSLTPTEQKIAAEQVSQQTLRIQRERIQADYADIRSERSEEFMNMRGRHSRGEIGDDEFEKFRKQFSIDNADLDTQESRELRELDKEMIRNLRLIIKELQDKRKLDTERAQRDNDEFDPNTIGALQGQNRDLRNRQLGLDDDDEIASLQAQIDANNAEIRRRRNGGGGDDDDEDSEGKARIRALGRFAGTAGSGDLVGTAMQAPEAMRGLGASAGTVGAVAGSMAFLYGLYEFLGQGMKLREDLAPVSSLRGLGMSAGATNAYYQSNIDPDGLNGNIGLDDNQMAALMYQKAKSSGVTGFDLRERTLKDEVFRRGFGADVGGLSEFERFGGRGSATIGLDILNVLTSIHESSLKSTDLVTLSEKISSGQTIMSLQRQKRDTVDTDQALNILAAFESIGLSSKGERGASFLNQTIEGLGEGGSDNLMLLKFEAAKRANPSLANNPAALRRMVKFNSDNPEYMNEAFKMMGELSGGDEMALDDMLYSFFPNLNENDMNIYKRAIKDGNFSALLKGKNLDKMKTRKQGLSINDAVSESEAGVGEFTKWKKDFKDTITEASAGVLNFFASVSSNGAIKVLPVGGSKNTTLNRDATIVKNPKTGK